MRNRLCDSNPNRHGAIYSVKCVFIYSANDRGYPFSPDSNILVVLYWTDFLKPTVRRRVNHDAKQRGADNLTGHRQHCYGRIGLVEYLAG
jgi:hypothetical protein